MKFSISTLVNTTLASVLLASVFLVNAIPPSSVAEYDPWCDLDDDGDIDIFDVVKLAGRYGTTGTSINKTALLLEMQAKIDSLNASLMELEQRVAYLEFTHGVLIGHWKFDEGDGVIAYDSSENGNNGTIYGANWTTGRSNSALHFNGVDNYVEIPDSLTLDCTFVTLEAWVKIDGTTGDHQIIVGKWYSDLSYLLEFQPDGVTPKFTVRPSLHEWVSVVSDTIIPFGSWTHIAGTYDGFISNIYVNGTLAGSQGIGGPIAVGNSFVCIGAHSPVNPSDRNWLKGIIDEVRVYNYALTPEEILADIYG